MPLCQADAAETKVNVDILAPAGGAANATRLRVKPNSAPARTVAAADALVAGQSIAAAGPGSTRAYLVYFFISHGAPPAHALTRAAACAEARAAPRAPSRAARAVAGLAPRAGLRATGQGRVTWRTTKLFARS